MERCWCHAVMSGWLSGGSAGNRSDTASMQRWQAECERAGSDCAARTEAIALRLPPAQAIRKGDTLRVFTAAGEVTFQNRFGLGDNSVQHRYLGMLEVSGHHVLWQRFCNGTRFLLLADHTAQHTALDSLPCLSPNGRHLLVVGNDSAGRANTVLLLQTTSSSLMPAFTFQAQGSALYGAAEWLSDTAARLPIRCTPDDGHGDRATGSFETVACIGGSWMLSRPAAMP
jgi:hypothetical protein